MGFIGFSNLLSIQTTSYPPYISRFEVLNLLTDVLVEPTSKEGKLFVCK